MADHFAAGRKEHVIAEHRRAGIGTAIELAQHGAVGDVTIGADHGIAIHHHPAEAVDEEARRSEEHTSELQSLMRNSYAVFCLKKKQKQIQQLTTNKHQNLKSVHQYITILTLHDIQ